MSREELIELRDSGKVDKLRAMKALSKKRKKEEPKKKVKEKTKKKPEVELKERKINLDTRGVEELVKVSLESSNKLMNKIDEIIEVERKGPLNTKWKLTVQRDNRDLISTIDVVAN